MVQLSTFYANPKQATTINSVADEQSDDRITPIADYTACSSTID